MSYPDKLGHNAADTFNTDISGLERHWDFVPSKVPRWRTRQLIETHVRFGRIRPAWKMLKPLTPEAMWTVYFIFAPDGQLSASHRFSLARLKDAGHRVMAICATSVLSKIPEGVFRYADAVYWKALSGYDFSAYTIALREISRRSPHANVMVINDSVYGPFSDLKPALERAPWELTGFTASSQVENHIQSYAFVLQDVTSSRMRALTSVMPPWTALDRASDVVAVQETRFARTASHSMRVGSYWFGQHETVRDPTLVRPIELIAAGFPFLKRSLIGKHRNFQAVGEIRELLHRLGHPVG